MWCLARYHSALPRTINF